MLRFGEHPAGNAIVVDVIGRLELGESEELVKDKINSLVFQKQRRIVLNLAALRIMDSRGFGALVDAGSAVARAGGRFVLANVGSSTAQMLIITGVLTHFPVFESEATALAYLLHDAQDGPAVACGRDGASSGARAA